MPLISSGIPVQYSWCRFQCMTQCVNETMYYFKFTQHAIRASGVQPLLPPKNIRYCTRMSGIRHGTLCCECVSGESVSLRMPTGVARHKELHASLLKAKVVR